NFPGSTMTVLLGTGGTAPLGRHAPIVAGMSGLGAASPRSVRETYLMTRDAALRYGAPAQAAGAPETAIKRDSGARTQPRLAATLRPATLVDGIDESTPPIGPIALDTRDLLGR